MKQNKKIGAPKNNKNAAVENPKNVQMTFRVTAEEADKIKAGFGKSLSAGLRELVLREVGGGKKYQIGRLFDALLIVEDMEGEARDRSFEIFKAGFDCGLKQHHRQEDSLTSWMRKCMNSCLFGGFTAIDYSEIEAAAGDACRTNTKNNQQQKEKER